MQSAAPERPLSHLKFKRWTSVFGCEQREHASMFNAFAGKLFYYWFPEVEVHTSIHHTQWQTCCLSHATLHLHLYCNWGEKCHWLKAPLWHYGSLLRLWLQTQPHRTMQVRVSFFGIRGGPNVSKIYRGDEERHWKQKCDSVGIVLDVTDSYFSIIIMVLYNQWSSQTLSSAIRRHSSVEAKHIHPLFIQQVELVQTIKQSGLLPFVFLLVMNVKRNSQLLKPPC